MRWCLIVVLICISQWLTMLSTFSCACWTSAFPFWKNVYSVILPILFFLIGLFVFWMLSCMSYLLIYIEGISLLLVISFPHFFSHSVGCLFILLLISFAMQMLVSLITFHLFIFAFISSDLGDRSKNILLWLMSKSILPKFFSRSFLVSALHLSLQSILSLFLYVVLENVIISFFYM